jgi:hypothetical protein
MDIHSPRPYDFIGSMGSLGTKPYEFLQSNAIHLEFK